jgi:hypothetical protein
MSKSKKQSCSNVIAALLITSGLIVSSLTASAQAACPQVLPNGKAYEKLAADWWKWALSFPVTINPLFDETGAQAYLGNQGNVFFLAGVFNESGTAMRTIEVPAGKPLFFPVLNGLWDNIGVRPPYLGGPFTPPAQPMTVPELYAALAANIASVSALQASVDGCPIPNLFSYRAKSAPFNYKLPATDNLFQFFGINVSGTITPAVTDGYWLFLTPLPVGEHTVNFGGTNGSFTLNITYHITVTP